ncbi:FAD-dependent monooxygenase [Pigmentiphaga sp.]|uniref:FAD-dependent monooxygenase n=1 Tax=Pigmentiphaga sp. TaxID=1977564 RepID=UPI0025EAED2F|nr:FAD-dependent monooxygenase [Pigmentiphaga sp.]
MRLVETDVLVIGAGPVGLSLAGDLGWRGIDCLLVEQTDGAILQPKMDGVGVRTMEFCRRWGIVEWVEAAPYNRYYPQDNAYLTSLNGYELEREPMAAMAMDGPPPESPQKRERCPQNMFDPVLRRFAAAQAPTTLLYEHRLESFEELDGHVEAVIRNIRSDATFRVRCRFLVGCDGGRSLVRQGLGIPMNGMVLTYTTNIVFRCPEFNRLHDKKPAYRYMFVDESGVWATIVAINGNDEWRMSIVGDTQRREYSDDELRGLARRALGRDLDLEILSRLQWTRVEAVADAYGSGNVFVAGDACHLTSPTGGLGMNTGIGDAVDLSWKLAAVLEGWGGAQLLASYGIERRPVAQRITRFSTGNLEAMKGAPSSAEIEAATPEGARVRGAVGEFLKTHLRREWFSKNMHLGNRYLDSPVIAYTEPEDADANRMEYEEPVRYRPSTRPGVRAPHVWLAPGESILDHYGRGFVMVSTGENPLGAESLEGEARSAGIPFRILRSDDPEVARVYELAWVLVRPDGHVAWRGRTLDVDARTLWRKVTGHQ